MEKIVKVTVDLKHARPMLRLAGFFKLANEGTDEEIFAQVLDMMSCYGAKTEIVSTPEADEGSAVPKTHNDWPKCRDGDSNSIFCHNCGEKARGGICND